MNEGNMHETIRGFYQGVLEPHAWQRSLYALCETSGSIQALLLVRDTDRQVVQVRQLVNRASQGRITPAYAAHDGLPLAGALPVGGWHIGAPDVTRKVDGAEENPANGVATSSTDAPATLPARGGERLDKTDKADEATVAAMMTCLVDRQPSREIYLTLRRPANDAGYSDADARALDWAIPHLREAMALRDRTHSVATHGHVSADLLNRLPFGVIVFAESGRVLLANADGEPWVRRLLPSHNADNGDSASDRASASASDRAPLNGQGWRLSRPFADVMRALCDPNTLQPAQAIHAMGADGRAAQIVAVALTPALYLSSEWQGQPVLVAIHENQGTPRAVPAVLRDLYGLTPAENRLAMLLTTGIGLPDASTQLGIKRETGRSQLKSIFTKTNTSTQAQLAHLLTRLGSVLAEPAGPAS